MAIEQYQKAISYIPKISRVYVNYGLALAYQGKMDEATDAYQKAIEVCQKAVAKDEYSYISWGRALEAQGKPDEAIKVYQKAIEMNPNATGYNKQIIDELQKAGDEIRNK